MTELIEKIVERYSDELISTLPLQKIISTAFIILLFNMADTGHYISAIESLFRLQIGGLIDDPSGLKKINFWMIFLSLSITFYSTHIQRQALTKISKFIANGFDLNSLSTELHKKSTAIKLDPEIASTLESEYKNKLSNKKEKIKKIRSFFDLIFTIATAQLFITAIWHSPYDFFYSLTLYVIWLFVNIRLIFQFIAEILPLEAHLYGIRGLPYEFDLPPSID